ncbi:MAG TPA: hypothetical protein PLD77_03065 [Candidatus Dojkabacteria bacterium]|nr:hypothetical protein [Candidatus Dojkabacteria bacterium]
MNTVNSWENVAEELAEITEQIVQLGEELSILEKRSHRCCNLGSLDVYDLVREKCYLIEEQITFISQNIQTIIRLTDK